MAEPILNTCCCVCSLELGSIIIAWYCSIELIFTSFLYLLYTFFALHTFIESKYMKFMDELTTRVPIGILCLFGIYSAVNLVITVLLLKGVYIKRPNYLLPWIGFTIFYILFTFLGSYFDVVSEETLIAIIDLIRCVIRLYMSLVVYSYYEEIKNGESGSRMNV